MTIPADAQWAYDEGFAAGRAAVLAEQEAERQAVLDKEREAAAALEAAADRFVKTLFHGSVPEEKP